MTAAPPLSFAEQLALLGAPLDIPDGSFAAGVISPEGGDTDDVLTISGGVAIWASIAAVAVSATLAFSDLSGSIANSQVPVSAVTQHEAALTILSSQVDMSKVGTPAFTTVQHIQDVFHSSGWVSGGVLSNDGSANIDVTSGEGLLRAADVRTDALLFADWSASDTNAISDGTAKFIGVEYAASPRIVVKASDTWDYNTDFPLGSVVREGSILHISQAEHAVGDHANFMIQRLYEVQKFARDNITGGLILGEDGANRYVTVSAGTIWERLNKFSISAIDTDPGGDADTFQTYKHVSGTFTLTTGVTTWPNTQYDDGTDLVTMGSSKYANLWFYLEPDGDLVMLYGAAQYTSSAKAELEAPPSTVPLRISTHAFLAARLIFQKSASSAEEINSVFTTVFSPTLVSDHGNLAGLTDDDHTQYILEDGTRDFSGNISHGGNDITSVGTITATTFSGALSGNASTATALETGRDINGVTFDGTASITVTAAAGTLTGNTLKSTVVTSSLTAIGTLSSGAVPASLVTAGTFGTGAYVFDNTVSGITTLTATTLAGTLSTAAQPNVTSLGTLAADFLFTDATHDVGKSGATRPRDLFLSRNLHVGNEADIGILIVRNQQSIESNLPFVSIKNTLYANSNVLYSSFLQGIDSAGTLTWYVGDGSLTVKEVSLWGVTGYITTLYSNSTLGLTLDTSQNIDIPNGTLTLSGGGLLFPDDTFDIGAALATRPKDYFGSGSATLGGVLYMTERAAALGDTVVDGQIWVKNTDPNELWFTDGDGTDHQVAFV